MMRRERLELRLLQHIRSLRIGLTSRRFRHFISKVQTIGGDSTAVADDLTVFTAADPIFLGRFGKTFITSLVRHVPDPRLHVHLYNPDSSSVALLKELASESPTLTLTWSSEQFVAGSWEIVSKAEARQSWKSLYICCSRFLAARQVQAELRTPMLIADIDILFNGDVKERFGANVDYALMLRTDEEDLTRRAFGAVVFVSYSAIGRMFLEYVCLHVSKFLAKGNYWAAFDQYALYRAARQMSGHSVPDGQAMLTVSDVNVDPGSNPLILIQREIKSQFTFC